MCLAATPSSSAARTAGSSAALPFPTQHPPARPNLPVPDPTSKSLPDYSAAQAPAGSVPARFLIAANPKDDVNPRTLAKLEALGVRRDVVVETILERRKNAISTLYYLHLSEGR